MGILFDFVCVFVEDMVSQEVNENDRLKKELDKAQDLLKRKNFEKSLSEAKPEEDCDLLKIQQEATNASSDWNASTEIQGILGCDWSQAESRDLSQNVATEDASEITD